MAKPKSETAVELTRYLSFTAACIRISGFVSRKAAQEQSVESTSDVAWGMALGKTPTPIVLPADQRLAEDAAAWARGLDPKGVDYLEKLQAVADAGAVTAATRGTAGSMVHAYQRAMEDLANAKRVGAGGWVGKVGDQFQGELVIDEVKPFDGRRGACWLVKAHGLVTDFPVAFFVNNAIDLTPGGRRRVEATIKACTEYRGRKETTLTRVTVCAAK